MLKFFEKWIIQRIIKRVAKQLPQVGNKALDILKRHKGEIYESVKKAIKSSVVKAVTDILAEEGISIPHIANKK